MATQYSYQDTFFSPESEYHAEQLKKRLQYQMANFAKIRFKRLVQMRMSPIEDFK